LPAYDLQDRTQVARQSRQNCENPCRGIIFAMRKAIVTLLVFAAGCAGIAPSPSTEVFTHGVAAGDMRNTSVILWTRTAGPEMLTPEIATKTTFEDPIRLAPAGTTAESDFTTKRVVSRLREGTKYYYRFVTDKGVASPTGTFTMPYGPGDRSPVRMAFTGDADWRWKPYPLLAPLTREPLDFFFFLGDLVYEFADVDAKTAVEDLAGYRLKYRENREPRPGSPSGMVPMRDLYGAFGQYSVIDNHEVAYSHASFAGAPPYPEGGAAYQGTFVNRTPGFYERLRAYREYQPVREEIHPRTGDARTDGTNRLYRSYTWGANVELIVLDTRSYRDARLKGSEDSMAASCTRTMLGATQMKWLQDTLGQAQRRRAKWKVIVTSSPIQEFGGPSQVVADVDGVKTWAGNYRCERNRILAFIDANGIDNVVFLTTDYHFTAVNDLWYETDPGERKSPRKRARNAFEIMTGPLGAINGPVPYGRNVNVQGLSRADAERRMLAVWNGDEPDADGKRMGLRQAGLAPLERVSFLTFTYALLTFTETELQVQVKGIPAIPDPKRLLEPASLAQYESEKAQDVLHFSVTAR
jgi:phosphodiesterase/alkaline phosphatase D-like protein